MSPGNLIYDPLTIATLGGGLTGGYYLLHRLVNRPGPGSYGAVGQRPPLARAHQLGLTSWVGIGGYGTVCTKVAKAFVRANCHGQVGGTLMFELDEDSLHKVVESFPIPRLVPGGSPLAKHGLRNRTIEEVNEPAVRFNWAFDLKQATSQFCAGLRRPGFLRPAFQPAIILCFVSTGGHLLLAMEAARRLQREFPRADLYAITIIPRETKQQRELVKALELHAQDPIFRFWWVTDNRLGEKRNDKAVATALASIWQARRVARLAADAPDPYNIMGELYRPCAGDDGGVVVLSYWEREVAVYPTPLPPRDFIVHRDDVVNAVRDGIYEVGNESNKCINLATPKPGLRRFVIVDVALRQPYLWQLQDEIKQRLEEDGRFTKDPNCSLIFSSLGENLTPLTQYITVSVAVIEAARDGVAGLKQLLLSGQASATESGVKEGAKEIDTPGVGEAKKTEEQTTVMDQAEETDKPLQPVSRPQPSHRPKRQRVQVKTAPVSAPVSAPSADGAEPAPVGS